MLTLLAATVLCQAPHYALSARQTELVALTKPAGLLAGASHPHVLVARQVSGEVVYDPAHPEATAVRVQFPADALENDEPAMRERFHLGSTLSASDRKVVAEHLREPGQLDVKKYPTVSFASTAARATGPNRLELTGVLTLRGVPVTLTVPVEVQLDGGTLRGTAKFGLTHAMFGFSPFTAALGAIRNAEEISVEVTLVGQAAAPAAVDGGS